MSAPVSFLKGHLFLQGHLFLKGHGTGNDFVLLPDLDDELDLSAGMVAALCDRRHGIGADGILRVVPDADEPGLYFMDYRNADGSLAEMCGNGARVFGRYLVDAGLQPAGRFDIVTRAGRRTLDVPAEGDVTVDMGPATFPGPDGVRVSVDGGRQWPAVPVDLGNPHAVVFVEDLADAGRLLDPPDVQPPTAFPHGVNVEFAVSRGPAHLAMRVHERGSGETQSCGTGACAVFAAARRRDGAAQPGASWTVDVPGGRLRLRQRDDGGIDLTGPVRIVASGTVDHDWLEGHR